MRRDIANQLLIVGVGCLLAGCGSRDSTPTRVAKQAFVDSQVRAASVNSRSDDVPSTLPELPNSGVPMPGDNAQPPASFAVAESTLQTALHAARIRLEVAAHNLANADTVGFKRSRVLYADASYRQDAAPGVQDALGNAATAGIAIGQGVRVRAVQLDLSPGPLRPTSRQFDIAIEGQGFFQVTDPTGQILYTRCGAFTKNANGSICLCSAGISRLLEPNISIPSDTLDVSITDEGLVTVAQAGNPSRSRVGQIQIGSFINPEGLQPVGEGLFAECDASGVPTISNPGQKGAGKVRQGMLEASNVDVEMERGEWKAAQQSLEALLGMRSNVGIKQAP